MQKNDQKTTQYNLLTLKICRFQDIIQLNFDKNNFQPEKFSLDIVSTRTFKQQMTLRMIFIKHNSLKSDIFFNPIFIPCFSASMFFRVQIFMVLVFQVSGFSGSRFFRVQDFHDPIFSESRCFRVQVFLGPGISGSRPRVRVQSPGPGFRNSQVIILKFRLINV